MSVFTIDTIPLIEQQAMRLDGEVYRVGDLFVPVGFPEVAEVRAAATRGVRSARLIAARRTAAWIWGAAPLRPAIDQFVVDTTARWRPRAHEKVTVIEAVLHHDDVVDLDGVLVTSRLRTVIDLCRFTDDFTPDDAATVRALGHAGGFALAECEASLATRPRLAGKRLTLQHLSRCWAPQSGRLSPN